MTADALILARLEELQERLEAARNTTNQLAALSREQGQALRDAWAENASLRAERDRLITAASSPGVQLRNPNTIAHDHAPTH